MSLSVIIVIILTFIMGIIGTLAYAVRVVGVKTGKIAIAFSVFNILVLIARTANVVQEPLLTKYIEDSIKGGSATNLLYIFRILLFTGTLAAISGAALMPTFIKVFSKAVMGFSTYRSLPKVIIHGFSKSGIEQFKDSISMPKRENLSHLKNFKKVPKKIVVLNIIASAISTVGVMASLYAACLNPDVRATCITLSAVINGGATILLFIFIDPYISMLTDDVIRGECTQLEFSRCIVFIVGGLIVGTILAQLLLVPAATIIGIIAKFKML